MRLASGSVRGLAVYSPSTLVRSTRRSASRLTATRALSPSLSPNAGAPVAGALRPPVLDQLPDAHAVVLVEDRHRAQLEQPHQRRPHAERAIPVTQVLSVSSTWAAVTPNWAKACV